MLRRPQRLIPRPLLQNNLGILAILKFAIGCLIKNLNIHLNSLWFFFVDLIGHVCADVFDVGVVQIDSFGRYCPRGAGISHLNLRCFRSNTIFNLLRSYDSLRFHFLLLNRKIERKLIRIWVIFGVVLVVLILLVYACLELFVLFYYVIYFLQNIFWEDIAFGATLPRFITLSSCCRWLISLFWDWFGGYGLIGLVFVAEVKFQLFRLFLNINHCRATRQRRRLRILLQIIYILIFSLLYNCILIFYSCTIRIFGLIG